MLRKRPGVELAGCWAHVRRKFHEAFVQKEATVRNGWILHQIAHLYAIEQRLRKSRAGPDLRAAIRPAALGRKNWLFIGAEDAAGVAP